MKSMKYLKIHFLEVLKDTMIKIYKPSKTVIISIIAIIIVGGLLGYGFHDTFKSVIFPLTGLVLLFLYIFCGNWMNVSKNFYEENLSLKEQQKSKLEIDFDENNPKYLYEANECDGETYASQLAIYRIFIRNTSQTQTINDVEVRIISIENCPEWLKGKTPINLNYDKKEHFYIHPGKDQPVGVVKYEYDSRPDEKQFAFCSNKRLQIPSGNFKIKIEVSGKDIPCKSKDFTVTLKYDECEIKKMISMKEY